MHISYGALTGDMMRKIALILVLVCLGPSIYAQDLTSQSTFTMGSTPNGVNIPLVGKSISIHQLQWWVTGTLTAGTCELDGSVDTTYATPIVIIPPQVMTVTGGPTPLVAGAANNVRIHCSTPVTGTGTLTVKYMGYIGILNVNPNPGIPLFAGPLNANPTMISQGPITLTFYHCTNVDAQINFIQMFDNPGTVTVGTTPPNASIGIPSTVTMGSEATGPIQPVIFLHGLQVAATEAWNGNMGAAPNTTICTFFGR